MNHLLTIYEPLLTMVKLVDMIHSPVLQVSSPGSLLTLRFIYIRLGAAPDAAAALGAALGALLTFLASPGAVLGLFCGTSVDGLGIWRYRYEYMIQ